MAKKPANKKQSSSSENAIQVVKITARSNDKYYETLLTLDKKVRFNLAADPFDSNGNRIETFEGFDLMRALMDKGAKKSDAVVNGKIIPAVQGFDVNGELLTLAVLEHWIDNQQNDSPDGDPAIQQFTPKGVRMFLAHYLRGQMNDAPNGDPAMLQFCISTGKLMSLEHKRNGKLQDSPSGDAARQWFDVATGSCVHLQHWQNGVMHDVSPSEPAEMRFDAKTGLVTIARSYKNDGSIADLFNNEIFELNVKKGLLQKPTNSLPGWLKNSIVAGAKPLVP